MDYNTKTILTEYVKGLSTLLGNHLNQVILYGSYARGDYTTGEDISDIDIMVLINIDNIEIENIEERVFNYTYDMSLKNNVLFSPVVENIEVFQKRGWLPYYQNVKREGVVLNGV